MFLLVRRTSTLRKSSVRSALFLMSKSLFSAVESGDPLLCSVAREGVTVTIADQRPETRWMNRTPAVFFFLPSMVIPSGINEFQVPWAIERVPWVTPLHFGARFLAPKPAGRGESPVMENNLSRHLSPGAAEERGCMRRQKSNPIQSNPAGVERTARGAARGNMHESIV